MPLLKMIVGIDLGTTNSLVGAMDAGFPILFPTETGSRLTPSVVYFPESGDPVVGEQALAMRSAAPAETVYSVKRLMGLRAGEIADVFPFTVAGGRGDPVMLCLRNRTYTPEQISSIILAKLKTDAERATGVSVDRAVITVPAYFNDAQRNATKTAGELAGFQVERILSEPTAAALAYGLDRLAERSKIAVFDLGGGTFDVSILELHDGVFQVLATNGDTHLGGDDLDAAIAGHIERQFGPPVPPKQIVERLKVRLSSEERGRFEFANASGEVRPIELTRDEVEKICRPVIERTRKHCLRSLADAKVAASDLDRVILVGGATRMPLVRQFVAEIFGRDPDTSQHPDEAVALGAAIQAGILDCTVQNVTLLDVTPLSLGIESFGGLMNVIIPRNTTIPVKRGEMFTNAASGQKMMRIRVLQGEREMARDNWQLGAFDLPFTPAPKGRARVGVQFEIDADGILNVLARDIATGIDTSVAISSAIDVSDEAVEKMLGDSLEHAFEDIDARVFVESTIKADEMLPAASAALDQLGGEVDDAERSAITALCDEARSAVAAEDGRRLKEVLAKLDQATQPLAIKLIEKSLRPRSRSER